MNHRFKKDCPSLDSKERGRGWNDLIVDRIIELLVEINLTVHSTQEPLIDIGLTQLLPLNANSILSGTPIKLVGNSANKLQTWDHR